MAIVKADSVFGNFHWFAQCEVSDVVRDILANLGFLWIMQRSPSSNAEKVLADYEKRPAGFKRSEIEYSDEKAAELKKLLGEPAEVADDVKITPEVLNVIFHEIGKVAEPKYSDEKKAVQRHIDAKDIVSWASEKVGFTGEGELDTNNIPFLQAVKALKQRLLQEQM
jgi:hypothetical protein